MRDHKKIILFGAGEIGRRALKHFGSGKVAYFADNNEKKAGTYIEGIPVICLSQLKKIYKDYQIILSMDIGNSLTVSAQLDEIGISEYILYLKMENADTENVVHVAGDPVSKVLKMNMQQGNNQVLMVAYYFPPLSGSGVFRSIKFAKYLSEFKWHPTIISTDRTRFGWNYMDEGLMKEVPEDIGVIRVPDLINTLRETSLTNREQTLLPFLQEILQRDKKAYEIFSSFLHTKAGRTNLMTFPCGALAWAYDVIQYIEKNMDINQFQVVYTTSDPYSTHLIGFYLKEKYGIPWVADYRDPWTKYPGNNLDFSKPYNQLFAALEYILLKQADCNIMVEESLAHSYTVSVQLPAKKVVCITNGYDEKDFSDLAESEMKSEKFTINYSGVLHTEHAVRAFSTLLEAIYQLKLEKAMDFNQISLYMIGDIQEGQVVLQKYDWGNTLVETGYVSHAEVLQLNSTASILLLPIGDTPDLKPVHAGKFFDYLRSGRRILALAPKGGVVDRTLQETGHGKAFHNSQISEIKEFILQEYQKWQRGEEQERLHSPLIERFERKNLTGQLASIFNEVCH